jgi:hypothetical protein
MARERGEKLNMSFSNPFKFKIVISLAVVLLSVPVRAQAVLTFVPLGHCQITSLASATLITGANCTRASFTGTGSGTNLTTTSVTGKLQVGDQLAGTGVSSGTFIVSQTSGTPNGAGVYVTNNPTTSNSASLTSGGIPNGATYATFSVEGAPIRWRDDKQAPTASVGMPVAVGQQTPYQSTLSALQLIQQSPSATVDFAFYR